MAQTPSDSGYHHGDLPATLMDLALERIAQEGTEKLSLRALAHDAGVSPTAPYRHFPRGKRCLLAALATRGFRELERINEQNSRDEADLEEAFLALGLGYVAFARENPTTYQIMFGTVIHDFSAYSELAEAAEASYAPVQKLIERIIESHPDWDMTPELLGGITWSAVHGIASLLIFGAERMDDDQDRTPNQALKALAGDPETALRTLVQGILHPTG